MKKSGFIQKNFRVIDTIAADLGRLCGISEYEALGRLDKLWRYCLLHERAFITATELHIHMPQNARKPLEYLGFIEETYEGDKSIKIKGVSDSLTAIENKRSGAQKAREKLTKRIKLIVGHDASGNQTKSSDDQTDNQSDNQKAIRGQSETNQTDNQSILSDDQGYKIEDIRYKSLKELHEQVVLSKKKPKKIPDTIFHQTVDILVKEFEKEIGQKYFFNKAKDAGAIIDLLKDFSPDEILRRWRIGLKSSGFHHTGTLAMLRSKFNDLADESKLTPKKTNSGPMPVGDFDSIPSGDHADYSKWALDLTTQSEEVK